jgi:hypothetical protein
LAYEAEGHVDRSVVTNPPPLGSPTSFASLAPDSWFVDREAESFWMRIVTPIGLPPAGLQELALARRFDVFAGEKLALAFGTLDDFKLPVFHFVAYAANDGTTIVNTHVYEVPLPRLPVWFFATPLRKENGTTFGGEARATIDRASAIIQVHLGRNTFRDVVFDGEVGAKSGKISVGSLSIRTPDAADGPARHPRLWEAIAELQTPIAALPIERRNRLFRSLEFVERASRDNEEFFYLWTAYELLCNGKANTIRSRLMRALDFKSVDQVDRDTGFGVVAKWRHDFIHKGVPAHLTTHVARYLEYMYVDLLRDELGLTSLKLTLQAALPSVGLDLSPIGLKNHRPAKRTELPGDLPAQ